MNRVINLILYVYIVKSDDMNVDFIYKRNPPLKKNKRKKNYK